MPVRAGRANTVRQAGKFAVIGGLATLTHIAAALLANAALGATPLWSNVIGFLVALGVSYSGNWWWTFGAGSGHGFALPRFLVVALAGFCINHAIVFLVSVLAGQPLWVAMIPVAAVVPALSFWLNKTRVFLPAGQDG